MVRGRITFWKKYRIPVIFILIILIGTFILRNPVVVLILLLILMLISDHESWKIRYNR